MAGMRGPPVQKLALFTLVWPIFIEQLLHQLVGIVDLWMVGRIPQAQAALQQPGQVLYVSIILFMFVGVGSSVIITHHLGAHDREGADRIAAAAIAVNTWIGLGVSVLVLAFAAPMLRAVRLPPELLPLAMDFLPVMGGTLFLEAQNISIGAVLRAHGHTRDPMWVTLAQNLVNAGGSALLIFGLLGLPRMGVRGVAIAGLASRLVAFACMWILLRRRTGVRMHVAGYFRIPLREVRRILHIGLPAAGGNLSWFSAYMVVTALIARLGPTALATMACVMSVAMFVVILGGSLGMATEILVGRQVGTGDFEGAYRLPLRSLRRGFAVVCAAVVPVAFAGPLLLGWLSTEPAVVWGGAALLLMNLVLEPGRVFNLVVGSALRATGDSRTPFLLTALSMWGVWIPLSWLLGLRLGLGLPGFWLAMIADEWLRGVVLHARWRRRGWLVHARESKAHAEAGIAEQAASAGTP
jgi:putative MATE family efflux protein